MRAARLFLALMLTLSARPPSAIAQEGDPEQVGSWFVLQSLDPFTDAGLTHLLFRNDNTSLSGVTGVTMSCDSEERSLWLRVLHSYMIGDDDQNLVLARFGSAEPKEMRGVLHSGNDMTDFTITPADIEDLRSTPGRLAIRFTDLGDRNSYQATWSSLEGTTEALGFITPCLGS